MIESAFEMGEESSLRDVSYRLFPPMWNRYDLSELNLDVGNWKSLKYLNNTSSDYSEAVSTIPNNCGGLYLFWVSCPLLGMADYPFYIGRAQYTSNQNLRARVKDYLKEYRNPGCRPKIFKMFRYWDQELMVSYIELDQNVQTVDYEKKLINSLLLPFNSQIPDVEIRQSVNAFPL